MSVLAEGVWPQTAAVSDGVLHLGGIDVRDLAAEFGTPAYVLDEQDFRDRCQSWRDAFAGADVYYAAKAFLCTEIARWIADEGLGMDVCTGGELAVAERVAFPPERLTFHGNNKSTAELREPHRVARYLEESVAKAAQRFWDECQVLPKGDEEIAATTAPRLLLWRATRTVLENGLGLLGVSAPERM